MPSDQVSWHILPFALTNFLGPLLLGRPFDVWGAQKDAGAHLWPFRCAAAVLGQPVPGRVADGDHADHRLDDGVLLRLPAASAAYLTVAENFPLEIRAMAIALFYAAATAIGGVAAPYLFGHLVAAGSRTHLFFGYLFAAALMLAAALVAWVFAVDAEGKSLEEVAPPLSSGPTKLDVIAAYLSTNLDLETLIWRKCKARFAGVCCDNKQQSLFGHF